MAHKRHGLRIGDVRIYCPVQNQDHARVLIIEKHNDKWTVRFLQDFDNGKVNKHRGETKTVSEQDLHLQ